MASPGKDHWKQMEFERSEQERKIKKRAYLVKQNMPKCLSCDHARTFIREIKWCAQNDIECVFKEKSHEVH